MDCPKLDVASEGRFSRPSAWLGVLFLALRSELLPSLLLSLPNALPMRLLSDRDLIRVLLGRFDTI
jgi:hypothetical protein